MSNKCLKLSNKAKVIGGRLRDYFDLDPFIIVLLCWVVFGGNFGQYVLLWLILDSVMDNSNDDVVQGEIDEEEL